MPRYTTGQTTPVAVTALGAGINDTNSSYGTISTATDYVSSWTPPTSLAYLHGGFDATGVTANSSVYPLNVVQMGMKVGGAPSGSGGSTASVYYQLATDNAGGGGYQDTVAKTTNSTATIKYNITSYDTGSLGWSINAGTTYWYGIHGASSGVFAFGIGGTAEAVRVNGTASTVWLNKISAQVIFDTVPSAPLTVSASINTSGQVSLTWYPGTDDGMTTTSAWDDISGAHITGYNVVYKATTDTAWKVFKANITSWSNPGSTTTGPRSVTGLTPDNGTFLAGKTYEFRIAALNGTTNAVQTTYTSITAQTGVRSASANALAPGGVYNGTTWAPPVIKVYNGSTWVTPTTFQVYNGSTWKTLI